MRIASIPPIVCLLLLLATPLFGLSRNIPAGYYVSDDVIDTRSGPLHNAIAYAPKPRVSPYEQRLRGRGVYVLDIAIVSGLVDHVRVLRSAGYQVLDDAAVEALGKWRFRPRSIHKLTIPIDFGAASARARQRQ